MKSVNFDIFGLISIATRQSKLEPGVLEVIMISTLPKNGTLNNVISSSFQTTNLEEMCKNHLQQLTLRGQFRSLRADFTIAEDFAVKRERQSLRIHSIISVPEINCIAFLIL